MQIFLSKSLLLLSLLLISASLSAQQPNWRSFDESRINQNKQSQRQINPNQYEPIAIDFKRLQNFFKENLTSKSDQISFEIPMPNGDFQSFNISESNVFSDGLAMKYPAIRTFKGRSIDGTDATIHLGLSPKGFHAMILSNQGTYFIDKFTSTNTNLYQSYYRKDYNNQSVFECLVEDSVNEIEAVQNGSNLSAGDCQLRKYRLALACTGEYANFHGGTVESVLAEYAVAMSRVNGIYERDNGITMELVDNTDEVIFFNAGTDPYTNNNGGTMLGENQVTLDDIIGAANYDIGHVFSTGGGGIASLQSPCGNGKARGVTGLNSPINDPFYVDYVSHEMGHQFGANHTQNNNCNRNNATAMEPGSANTIMGYAGICAPNTANNSDDHFHAVSIAEIANFIVSGNGATCAEYIALDNSAPEISVEQEVYNLPIGTSFKLEASATDADGNDLTFCWEQMDNETATMPPVNTSDRGPAFLSIPPKAEPYRYFPNINAIINNQIPTWEVIPFVERSMSFTCTVRDNNSNFGCTDELMVELEFNEDAGPFLVMNPNTNLTWNSADTEEVTWDVAGTTAAPVSCALVDIYLSIDGGFTYPILVEANVENDGIHEITVPAVNTEQARIMVKCSDNIFFDISDEDFIIKSPFSIFLNSSLSEFCTTGVDSIIVETEAFDNFEEAIDIEFSNVPDGLNVTISDSPLTPPNSATIYIENISAAPGTYSIVLQAISSIITIEETIIVEVKSSDISAPILSTPSDGATDLPTEVELFWNEVAFAEGYTFQMSTNPDFTGPTVTVELNETDFSVGITGLTEGTVYYWKVQALNSCVEGNASNIFAFQTAQSVCTVIAANDLQIQIPTNATSVITNQLEVSGIGIYDYMKVSFDMDHTWLGDVKTTITSPVGTDVVLFDQIGVPASEFGCDADDMILDFFDASINTADDLEGTCGNFATNYQSVDPLTTYDGENVNGFWEIAIQDFFDEDGGELDSWALEFCTVGINSDGVLKHNPLVLNKNETKSVNKINLDIENSADEQSIFVLMSLPAFGVLEIDLDDDGTFELASVGTTFTEQDVSDNLVRYTHGGDDNAMDSFLYDAIDENQGWSHNEVFNIIINDGSLIAFAAITEDILCNGGHNGVITIEALGGEQPYQYSIDGQNFQDEPIFNELTAGTYTITVLDVNGQEVLTDELTLTEPDPIIAESILDFYNIVVNASGGSPGYTYSIDGQNYQESNVFVKPGNDAYTIFVKDENGCIESAFITVDIPELMVGLESTGEILCFGDDSGIIEASGVGGYSPYTYSLDGNNYNEENTFNDLPAGTYTIYVKDAGGLITTTEITIESPDQIVLTGTFANNELVLEGSGGTGILEYSIDETNFDQNNLFEDYGIDPFTGSIQDENGCLITLELVPLYAALDVDEIECFGDNNGKIELLTQGGSLNGYEYSLDNTNFQSENVFDNLMPGSYTVYIRDDANNTYTTSEISFTEPNELTATATFDGSDVITVNANGGTGTIFYSFDGGSTFKDINTYNWMGEDELLILVKDENGCEIELMFAPVNNKEFDLINNWTIYPNPANHSILIESTEANPFEQFDVLIINNLGQILIQKRLEEDKTKINTENLSEGLYHVLFQDRNRRYSKKLVIVHE